MIRFGRFELDAAARELRADGSVVHLEPQAFDLLVHLVSHRGRVVPREELLDEVWGHRYVSDAALTTRIKEVRRALDDDGQRQVVVRNVRGRGYRFVATVDGDAAGPDGRAGGPGSEHPTGAPVPETPVPEAPVARLIGRDSDLAEVLRRLTPGSLVTITGPGGVGKTSLAAEVLGRLDPSPEEGVVQVELGELTEPAAVAPAIARRLGVAIDGSEDGPERLVAALVGRDLALLVDNAEHVIDEVARILGRVPVEGSRLRVLVTSRERLGVTSERVWPLAPLDRVAALELFAARAAASAPHLVGPSPAGPVSGLAGQDLAVARRLVDALDGLPLAIEMAAARLSSVDLDELERVVTHDLPSLRSADRSAAVRHRSVHEVVEWSVGLLSDHERRVLREAVVFAGATDLDTLDAVLGASPGEEPAAAPIRTVVADLVDRSLMAVDRSARPTRYHLLHTVRAVVEPAFERSPRATTLRDRHAAHHLERAVALDAALRSPAEPEAHAAFASIVPELRVAWAWLRVHAPDRLAELAGHVHLYAYSRFWSEPATWAERTRRAAGSGPAVAAVLDAITAASAAHRGDAARATTLARSAIGVTTAADAIAFEVIADAGLYTGELEAVRWAADRLAAVGRALDDVHTVALADVNRSLAATYGGDPELARSIIEALPVDEDELAPSDRAWRAYCLGEAVAARIDLDGTAPSATSAASAEATEAFDRAIALASSVEHRFAVSVARASRATALARSGDAPTALAALADCLADCLAHGNLVHAATMIRNLTDVLVALDDPRTAVVLHAAFASPRMAGSYGEEERRTREVLEDLERRLGTEVVDRWRREGRELTLDRAIERAVDAAHRHGAPLDAGGA